MTIDMSRQLELDFPNYPVVEIESGVIKSILRRMVFDSVGNKYYDEMYEDFY